MTGSINARTYAYRAVTTTKTTGQIATLTYPDLGTPLTYTYTYDSLGNIQTISDPLQGTRTYTYDSQNQLVQEKIGSTTYSYSYDNAGNLLTATNSTGSHTYTYGDSTWGDLLMKYDGQSITYDTIGNPTSYYNGTRWTLTWKNGRQLATASNGTNSISYTYDANGLRHSKTVDGVVYTYYYEGGRLMRMTVGTSITIDFFYDQNGQPFAMKYNGTILYYVLNAQGDVVRIVNASGGSYGIYKYDAWGNILYITDNQYLNNNPLRYRGYIYDSDSSLYYVSSRYYDPEIGRFINSDVYAATGQGILGNNMFAYCGNNPISRVDHDGQAWETVFDILSLGSSIAGVAVNPADPWAWLALAGDIADVAIPFVGGLGEAAKALKVVSESACCAEDAADVIEITSNTLQVIKDASKALSPGSNSVYVAYTADGLLEYVGITNDFNRRQKEWEGIRDIVEFVPNVDRAGARYVEQTVITLFGMNKNGGLLSNAINSIGVRGSKYPGYIKFISDLLGSD